MKLRSVLLWLLPILSVAQTQAVTPTLALTHVTVIDATGAPVNRDMTVIISGGRIRELGNSAKLHPPREAQIIDATGKFLIPGLWDMHVHWGDTDYLPLFLAN